MFLKELSRHGINCKGIEVDPYQIKVAQNSGLDVSNISLNSLENNSYNLCVMFDVLEHLVNPINEFIILN